jgi:hypothetical protein
MYQTGVSGTLHGETGWDTLTSTQLWPFPNESIWAAKMKAYTATGPGGNRGFAALSGSTATPLTDYIWGYLGTPIAASAIYTGIEPPSAVNGTCGTSNGGSFISIPTTLLCGDSSLPAVSGTGTPNWSWTCAGVNGGTSASCTATLYAAPVAGSGSISKASGRFTLR